MKLFVLAALAAFVIAIVFTSKLGPFGIVGLTYVAGFCSFLTASFCSRPSAPVTNQELAQKIHSLESQLTAERSVNQALVEQLDPHDLID